MTTKTKNDKRITESKQKYEGQTFDLKHGYTTTIIEYINAQQVIVQWSDGIISKTSMYCLRTKTIKHPDWTFKEWKYGQTLKQKYEGEVFELRNGYTATVIEYVDSKNVKIQFNDGVERIVYMRTLQENHIRHPHWSRAEWQMGIKKESLINKTFPISNGLTITIIKIINFKNITVKYSDGHTKTSAWRDIKLQIVQTKHTSDSYLNINYNTSSMAKKYIGRRYKTANGYNISIIDYKGSSRVLIKWSDGATSISTLKNVEKGHVQHPSWSLSEWKMGVRYKDLMGRTFNAKHGYTIKILSIENAQNITIQWSDNIKSSVSWLSIQNQKIKHPDWTLAQWIKGDKTHHTLSIGDVIPIKHGLSVEIINKKPNRLIDVKWSDGVITTVEEQALNKRSIKHPDWKNGEWRTGEKYSDIMSKTFFDTIGMPVYIKNMQDRKHFEIVYATQTSQKGHSLTQFYTSHKAPKSIIITTIDDIINISGTLWDIKILNIAYILNNITYLTCKKPNGDHYITSIPDLYEEKTGKSYPYNEFQQHLKTI